MAIYSSVWFWLLIIGILLAIFGVIGFLWDSISTTIAWISLGVGVLLAVIGGVVLFLQRDRRKEKERQMEIQRGGEFVRGEIQKNVPYFGTAVGKRLGESLVQAGDATLVAATVINNLMNSATDFTTKSIQKIKRIIAKIIITVVLTVSTAGVGGAVFGAASSGASLSGVVSAGAAQVGTNVASATIQQIGLALGKELLATGVSEGTALASKGVEKAFAK